MYDIHSHIIYGVDDGAESMEESLKMAALAAEFGIRGIIATPHYIDGLYTSDYESNLYKQYRLRRELEKSGIDIELYLGNEVSATLDLPRLIKLKKVTTLNNSRYLLVELPPYDIPIYMERLIFDLGLEGYVVVLAHPERNESIINKPDRLYNMIKLGALVQMNISSIVGGYGRRIERTSRKLLEQHMVHIVGTDSHSSRMQKEMEEGISLLYCYCPEQVDSLLYENPERIIKNEPIRVNISDKAKKRILKRK